MSRRGIQVARGLGTALTRTRGTPVWDAVIRSTGLVGLLGLLAVALRPDASGLVGFMLVTIWVHGPASPLLPAAYEPVLMLLGGLYGPLLVAVLGTAGNLYVEYLNYHLYGRALELNAFRRIRESRSAEILLKLFRRAPFAAVWVGTWSPLPDWVIRLVAPLAKYPVSRYLVAMGLGRLPRFWFFAELGRHWRVPPLALAAAVGASAVVGVGLALWRARASHRVPEPLPSPGLATPVEVPCCP